MNPSDEVLRERRRCRDIVLGDKYRDGSGCITLSCLYLAARIMGVEGRLPTGDEPCRGIGWTYRDANPCPHHPDSGLCPMKCPGCQDCKPDPMAPRESVTFNPPIAGTFINMPEKTR